MIHLSRFFFSVMLVIIKLTHVHAFEIDNLNFELLIQLKSFHHVVYYNFVHRAIFAFKMASGCEEALGLLCMEVR